MCCYTSASFLSTKDKIKGSDSPNNLVTLCWKCHAVAHGTRTPDYPEYVTQDYIEQAIVEYIFDYVAEVEGREWDPFS